MIAARILLIEDDIHFLASATKRIGDAYPDHQLEIVEDIDDGISKALPGIFHAVILDLHRLNPSEILAAATRISQHMPVLIWAATVTAEMTTGNPKVWALPRSASDYLPDVLKDMLAPAANIGRELVEIRSVTTVLSATFTRIEEQHDDIHKFLFRGNGMPPLIRQLETMTARIALIERDLQAAVQAQESTRRLVWSGLATLGSILMIIGSIFGWLVSNGFLKVGTP